MKILVCTFTYAPNVDGVSEAAQRMVEKFRHAGHKVFVATTGGSYPLTGSVTDDGFVHRFQIMGAPAITEGFRGEVEAYLDFVVNLNPDILVFHGWDTWPCELAIPLRERIRSKFILVSHGYSAHLLNLHLLPRGLWKWLRWLPHVLSLPIKLRQYDQVVFLSHKTDLNRFFDAWVARITRCPNTTIIPNGVPEPRATKSGSFRMTHEIGTGPMFLCIANYSERKNQERALRAFTAAALPQAMLVFIGSELGDYGRRMVALWAELQSADVAGRVLFLEGLPRDETLAALHDCDVKILAADAETQPIVLLEAMAASKPFISTNTGCVDEFNGGIVVRGVAEMSVAMRRLAFSSGERRKLGEEGRRDYELHYSLERTSKAWLELLDDLVVAPTK